MKKIFSILASVLLLVSCENDVKTNTPAIQGEKDNLFWKAEDSQAILNPDNTVTLNGYTDFEHVTVTVPNAVGTYNLGTSNQAINASYTYSNEGTFLYNETAIVPGPVYKLGSFASFGSGYALLNGNNLNTTGGSGLGLTLRITSNSAGQVTAATIASRGTGYKAGDIVTIAGGNNNAKVRILNVVQSNGTVTIEKIENGNYTGTFSFNAVDDNGNVVNFNKCTFYKVPVY